AVNLGEEALVREVLRLRRAPTAEHVVNGYELDFGKQSLELCGGVRVAWTIEVASGDLLTFLGVEEFKIALCRGSCALALRDPVDERHRRLCQDRQRGDHNFELVLAELFQRQKRLILPGQQDVTDTTFSK